MAGWSTLKKTIANAIKANGNQEITGNLLQGILTSIVNGLGEHAGFAGIAEPSAVLKTSDGPIFYIAASPGNYSNGLSLQQGELAVFEYFDNLWSKKVITTFLNSTVHSAGIINIAASDVTSVLTEKIKAYASDDIILFIISDINGNYPALTEKRVNVHSSLCVSTNFFFSTEPRGANVGDLLLVSKRAVAFIDRIVCRIIPLNDAKAPTDSYHGTEGIMTVWDKEQILKIANLEYQVSKQNEGHYKIYYSDDNYNIDRCLAEGIYLYGRLGRSMDDNSSDEYYALDVDVVYNTNNKLYYCTQKAYSVNYPNRAFIRIVSTTSLTNYNGSYGNWVQIGFKDKGEYLSRVKEDTAQEKITFEKGLEIGDYEPLMGGGNIDGDGNAELNSLKLRESLIVPEIKYNRATVFKGIQYLTFGGGVIESVTSSVDRSGTLTLKLEDGEALSVKVGDLCVGFWHSMKGEDNSDDNYDGKNGNFRVQGFAAIYFEVLNVLDEDKGKIQYLLRDGYNVHPQKGLNFACYSNNIQYGQPGYDADRHACKITTTDYEIRLQKLYNWEYSSDNIYRIEGKLDGFKMVADLDGKSYLQKFEGHGVVFGNAYMYGTLQQFDREVWSMVLRYENDNLLSDTPKLLSCEVYRNGIEVDSSNDGTGGTFGNISYKRISEDSDSDDQWNNDHSGNTDISILLTSSDLPDGYDTATFEVTAVCYSMGVDGNNSNVTYVTESVTFHRLKQGRGIASVTEYYAVSNDNVKAPETGWMTPSNENKIPSTTRDKRYLWNYEKITYDKADEDGIIEKKTTPAVIGTYGDDGRGIESITEYYGVSSDVNTVPTTWHDTPQTTDSVNKYLWNYEVVTYTDDTAEATTPAIIGTYGEKGNDGNDGKDAVQPNYMDGTSVDGTVERNEWRVNTYNNSSNPYYVNANPQFEDFPHLTLNPSVFGKKCRFTFDIKGSFATVSEGAYYVLQTAFSLPWVKGIVQPTENLNKLYGYAEFTIGGTTYKSSTIDSGYLYSEGITVTNVSVQLTRNNTTTVPTSGYDSRVNLTTTYKYLFVRLAITKSNGSVQYSGGLRITTYEATSSVTVYASNAAVFTNVEGVNNTKPTAGVTLGTSKWLSKKNYSSQSNLVINESANTTFTFPSNTTDFSAYLRIYGMYNFTNNYTIYKNIKAELYDAKRTENTAYIPSENDKARATNVNLLDGTRNGKNSEGTEIWTKTTNDRGTITFGDNLFTLISTEAGKGGNCMYITSPKINLLQGNYTLSFDMKMVNCYGARLYIDGTSHTIASTTDWTTHRLLLPKYSGEKTFRFDSFLSVASGTTSYLYIRNIKLEEGCFGTAWTISENDKGGKPGFTYRPCGTYDPEVLYVANNEVRDAVYYKDGNSNNTGWYICRVSNKGQVPSPNSTYWEKSSYIKFLSVEALFADNLFADAIQSGSGYFDGLNAKEVRISGELNATKGTFHDVVINGAYNKLIQTIKDDNWTQFFYKDDYGYTYPLLHSWGDVVKIDLTTQTNITNHIKLPSLLPIQQNEFASYTAYKKDSESNVVEITSHDDIRSLLGRQIILYISEGSPQLSFFTNVFYRVEQPLTKEFNALSIDYDQFFTTDSGFGINNGITLILQLKLGYRVIENEPCEMLYWEVTTINKWIE